MQNQRLTIDGFPAFIGVGIHGIPSQGKHVRDVHSNVVQDTPQWADGMGRWLQEYHQQFEKKQGVTTWQVTCRSIVDAFNCAAALLVSRGGASGWSKPSQMCSFSHYDTCYWQQT
jgi:hypothetical protein